MIPIVTPDQMRAIDAAATEPVAVLIDRAGAAVERAARRMLGGTYGRRVVVIAGKGNNGNDGRVAAARLTRAGAHVVVLDAAAVGPGTRLGACDLVIDAAYGTGFRGTWPAPDVGRALVLAVDIPSGVDGLTGTAAGPVLPAARTVTFAALKPGLLLQPGRSLAGVVEVVDIGLAADLGTSLIEGADVASWLPARSAEAHKWRAAVWVVAGSAGMLGAAHLASRAAQRAGAGMVRLTSPGVAADPMQPTEVVGVAAPGDGFAPIVLAELDRAHALVVGPGLGRSVAAVTGVQALVAGSRVPTLIDGDGLFAVRERLDLLRDRTAPTILTPHDGEHRLLTGALPGADRFAAARDLAARTGAIVLLKGATTIVAEPGGVALAVTEGDARLATAGTGDVLAGLIGALLAQGLAPVRAAAAGAWLHGAAARLGPERGLVAGDLPDLLPEVLADLAPFAVTDAVPERWAWAEIDLGAIRENVAYLRATAEPAEVWAVVKADGYGHGAVPVARAALEGGARGLAVALVQEGVELRRAGITAPILVLSEPPAAWMPAAVAHGLHPAVYTPTGVDAAADAAAASSAGEPLAVHLKLDTGMHRVGADPVDAVALAQRIQAHPALRLEGVLTHLAAADEPERPATAAQLARFEVALDALRREGIEPPLVHAANSAGAIAHPSARYSLVRAGIATYGLAPGPELAASVGALRPALSLRARVSFVKRVAAAEQISYGLRHTFDRDTVVATLPLGYADGVPRRLFATGGEVLVGGRRRPIVGVVTMDQLMVDCGPDAVVTVGDEVVLLGRQGDEVILADEWAERLGTINYEIVCGISSRVPRRYVGGSAEGGR